MKRSVLRLLLLLLFRLKFGKRLVDEFQLHPCVFVDVVLVGEHFFDVIFEFFYLILQFIELVRSWHAYHLPYSNKSPHYSHVYLYCHLRIKYTAEHCYS